MRIASWTPDKYDGEFNEEAMRRLTECAEIVADWARVKCKPGTITRAANPGQPRWMEREPGNLRRSIRVVRKKTKKGRGGKTSAGSYLWKRSNNVRVIAGHYLTFYPRFLEFGTSRPNSKHSFLRPALYSAIPEIRSIMGVR